MYFRKISDQNKKLEEGGNFTLTKVVVHTKMKIKIQAFLHCWAYVWGQFDFMVKITNLGGAKTLRVF